MNKRLPHIYGVGLVCPAGTDFTSSIASYASGDTFFGHDNSFIGPDGMGQIIAPALPTKGRGNLATRLYDLLDHAHRDCVRRIVSFETFNRFPMILLLPERLYKTATAAQFARIMDDAPLDRVKNVEIFYGSHVDGLLTLHRANMDLVQKLPGGVFIATVDSYIDPDMLDYLNMLGLAHSLGTPYGFIPAEAASVLFVSLPEIVSDIAPIGRIFSVDWSFRNFDVNKQPLLAGEELTESCRKSCDRLNEGQSLYRLLVDLDGSRHQAEAFGRAVTALGMPLRDMAQNPEAPISTLGEMGSAVGLVMAALACGQIPLREKKFIRQKSGDSRVPKLCFLSTTAQTDNAGQAATAIIETIA